ncbi:hypothetical protein [Duganella sp. CF517]|uniref:aldose epimerase family protein n=1 Tax=Duganella sp. CF517 TaxID=1881038 RepID=UPI0015A65555|nr:hypothetical protein [Duganella sp. CF517]
MFPLLGGAVGHWRWNGIDILRPASPGVGAGAGAEAMAGFPLLPYAGFLGNAELPGFGRLAPGAAPARPGLDGIGWQRPWAVTAAAADSVELMLRHGADRHWPFDFLAVMRFSLASDTLSTTLALTNLDARPMPAGAGFYSVFPIDAFTRFDSDWRGVWELGDDPLPARYHPVVRPAPRLALGWGVNSCFTGWRRAASLAYASHRVTVRAGSGCHYLQCRQSGPAHPEIVLAPVSHAPNAHQMRVPANHGLRQLDTGMRFIVSMSINVEAFT